MTNFTTETSASSPPMDSLFALWMLPLKTAKTMLEAGATMMGAALEESRKVADKRIDRGEVQAKKAFAAAEEQLGKLDDAPGDTAVNPAALVS